MRPQRKQTLDQVSKLRTTAQLLDGGAKNKKVRRHDSYKVNNDKQSVSNSNYTDNTTQKGGAHRVVLDASKNRN